MIGLKGWGARRPVWFVVALVLAGSTSAIAEVVYFQDAEGVLHFTNVPGPGYARYQAERPLLVEPIQGFGSGSFAPNGSYDDVIAEYAAAYSVEPALVKAVIRAESGFRRLAMSPKGARGLMQLMPGTAKLHAVANVWSPRDNIRGGVRHLRLLIDRYGMNLPWVLAAYNAGTDAVERYRGIPPYAETQEYVKRVLRFRREYLRAERLASK